MQGLEGRTAVVTGGASGLGAALSRALANAGASVAVFDMKGEGAARIVRELRETSVRCSHHQLDISDERSVEDALQAVALANGGVDIVINNAGTDRTVPIDEMATADWDRISATNLRAPFLISRWAARHMRQRK